MQHFSILFLSTIICFITVSGMDDLDGTGKTGEKLPRLKSLSQLRSSMKRDGGLARISPKSVDPKLVAEAAYTITYNQDPDGNSPTVKKLEENLRDMEENNPAKYAEHAGGVLSLTKKYGNISAKSIRHYKAEKSKQNTPKSDSESPKKDISKKGITFLEKQSTITEEMTNDNRFIKELFREMVFKSAEDASQAEAKKADAEAQRAEREAKRADRNQYIGIATTLIGTLGSALISGLAAYYSAVISAHANGGSTPPAPSIINGTL